MTEQQRQSHPQKLRTVPILVLRPSQRLSPLVRDVIGGFPYPVRHLLKGLGAEEDTGFELLSYLAFEPSYTERLMELGYQDTLSRRQEIEAFVLADRKQTRAFERLSLPVQTHLLVRDDAT
jgi:NTE family protein